MISIIIPSYNEEEYLPHLLDSLILQTNKNFEVIVVDGVSEDKTVQKITPYTSKLTMRILTSKVKNVSVQRNLGIKNAKGDWLLILDADTVLPKNFISSFLRQTKIKRFDIAIFRSDIQEKNKLEKFFVQSFNIYMHIWSQVFYIVQHGCLIAIKKDKIKKLFNPRLKYFEDYDFVKKNTLLGGEFTYLFFPKYYISLRRFREKGYLNMSFLAAAGIVSYELADNKIFLGPRVFKTLEKRYHAK